MVVVEGYCDEIVEGKLYRLNKGDVIHLPSNIEHGAYIRDMDCVVIDIFSPAREDFKKSSPSRIPGKTGAWFDVSPDRIHFSLKDEPVKTMRDNVHLHRLTDRYVRLEKKCSA